MKYQRICIFGGPAAGKTHLANELSELFGYKIISLDDLVYADKKTLKKRSEKQITRLLKKTVAKSDSWIIEGGYLGWSDFIFQKADVVLVLKTNRARAMLRIIRRFLSNREYGLLSTVELCVRTLPAYYTKEVLEYPHKLSVKKIIELNNNSLKEAKKCLC